MSEPNGISFNVNALEDLENTVERKLEYLSARVERLEKKSSGALLAGNQEEILYYLVVIYIAAEFIVPAVIKLVRQCRTAG